MDAKLKADWVKALRSGEYEQGREALHCEGAYCCLGVFCAINNLRINEEKDAIEANDIFSGYSFLKKFGLDKVARDPLVRMNDGGKSFAEIADYIEANIPADETSVA